MENDFLNIAEEIRIEILANLDALSIIQCASTCKSLYITISRSVVLRYIIQLYQHGFIDSGQSSVVPHADLMKRLQKILSSYMFPKWTLNNSVKMQLSCLNYDLDGEAFVSNSRTSGLEFAPIGRSDTFQWPTEVPIRNFVIDHTQALFVLVEDDDEYPPSSTTETRLVRIHLYGYNGPHPAAANHILEFTIVPDEWGNMMSLSIPQVSDNILSHYYYGLDEQGDSQSRVLIWDWKTSELLLDSSIYFPALLPTIGSVFCLLDSTYFLILSELDSGSISLCKLFRPSSTAAVSVIHLASLLLPPMAEGVRLNRSFSTHAASRSAKPFVDKHLFEGNPEDQLHVFTLTYTNGYYPLDRHNLPIYPAIDLFVHRHVFTKYSRMGELSGNPVIVPWAEWGPSNARIIHPSRTQTWTPGLRDIHEQRAILQMVKIRHPFAKSNTIEILDFSQAIVSPVKQGLVQSRSLLPPSIIRASDILLFRDDVETHLPCVSFAAQFPEDYSFFLIHALGVIGLSIAMLHGGPFARFDSYLF